MQQATTLEIGDRFYLKRFDSTIVNCATVIRVNKKSVTLSNGDRLELPFSNPSHAIGAGSRPGMPFYYLATPALDAQFEFFQLRRQWLDLHNQVVPLDLTTSQLTSLVQAYRSILNDFSPR